MAAAVSAAVEFWVQYDPSSVRNSACRKRVGSPRDHEVTTVHPHWPRPHAAGEPVQTGGGIQVQLWFRTLLCS